jgi:hypothetical protein
VEATSRSVFLVVYAVLWAAVTPTFGRLRLFSISSLWAPGRSRYARRRLVWGLFVADFGAVLVLASVWWSLAPVGGFPGVLVGGIAGLAPVGLPRVLHAILASDERWEQYYTPCEWRDVMRQTDRTYKIARDNMPRDVRDAGMNRFRAHMVGGLCFLIGFPLLGILLSCVVYYW